MDCSDVVDDEIEALRGIYCGPDEFEIFAGDKDEKVIVIKVRSALGAQIQVTVSLNQDYPSSAPQLALQVPCLSRSQLDSLESKLRIEADQMKGDPMILSLVSWISEQVTNLGVENPNSINEECVAQEVTQTLVINLDHIRSQHMYTKILSQWCRDLSLQGLLFWRYNYIWLLMSGTKGNVREYLKLHRTCNVDVDSSGRPCKERLLVDVGCVEGHGLTGIAVGQLKVSEWKSEDRIVEWKEFLSIHGIVDIYEKFMQPFMNHR